jgi:hypothetical protein
MSDNESLNSLQSLDDSQQTSYHSSQAFEEEASTNDPNSLFPPYPPWRIPNCGGKDCFGSLGCVFVNESEVHCKCQKKIDLNYYLTYRLATLIHLNHKHLVNTRKPEIWQHFIDTVVSKDELFQKYRTFKPDTLYIHFEKGLKGFIKRHGLKKFQSHQYKPGYYANIFPKKQDDITSTPYDKLFSEIYSYMDVDYERKAKLREAKKNVGGKRKLPRVHEGSLSLFHQFLQENQSIENNSDFHLNSSIEENLGAEKQHQINRTKTNSSGINGNVMHEIPPIKVEHTEGSFNSVHRKITGESEQTEVIQIDFNQHQETFDISGAIGLGGEQSNQSHPLPASTSTITTVVLNQSLSGNAVDQVRELSQEEDAGNNTADNVIVNPTRAKVLVVNRNANNDDRDEREAEELLINKSPTATLELVLPSSKQTKPQPKQPPMIHQETPTQVMEITGNEERLPASVVTLAEQQHHQAENVEMIAQNPEKLTTTLINTEEQQQQNLSFQPMQQQPRPVLPQSNHQPPSTALIHSSFPSNTNPLVYGRPVTSAAKDNLSNSSGNPSFPHFLYNNDFFHQSFYHHLPQPPTGIFPHYPFSQQQLQQQQQQYLQQHRGQLPQTPLLPFHLQTHQSPSLVPTHHPFHAQHIPQPQEQFSAHKRPLEIPDQLEPPQKRPSVSNNSLSANNGSTDQLLQEPPQLQQQQAPHPLTGLVSYIQSDIPPPRNVRQFQDEPPIIPGNNSGSNLANPNTSTTRNNNGNTTVDLTDMDDNPTGSSVADLSSLAQGLLNQSAFSFLKKSYFEADVEHSKLKLQKSIRKLENDLMKRQMKMIKQKTKLEKNKTQLQALLLLDKYHVRFDPSATASGEKNFLFTQKPGVHDTTETTSSSSLPQNHL